VDNGEQDEFEEPRFLTPFPDDIVMNGLHEFYFDIDCCRWVSFKQIFEMSVGDDQFGADDLGGAAVQMMPTLADRNPLF
jgi:hypothetical protein